MQFSSNILQRSLSALIAIPLIYILTQNIDSFTFLILTIQALMGFEVFFMLKNLKNTRYKLIIYLLAISYITIPSFLLIKLYKISYYIIWQIFLISWITDIFCLIFGKIIKGPKLCPKISPGKTWSGSLGGLIAVVIFYFIFKDYKIIQINDLGLLTICLASIIGQVGDLFESFCKRKFQVKDSGSFLPGHGGVLDRVDSIIFVTIFFYFIN